MRLCHIRSETHRPEDVVLTDSRIEQLVVYVKDQSASRRFYHDQLGLHLLSEIDGAITLDAGGITIDLLRAADYGVELFGRRDDSSDIVFLTEDLERTRAALERRGVQFIRRRSYEVGLVTDFYDPNGHRLMLYQPSVTALTWPSADKIRDVWRIHGHGGSTLIGPAARPAIGTDLEVGLVGKPLIYLFMFENNQLSAYDFYSDALKLRVLERVHCCNQNCDDDIEGIVKYDGGDLLLSTHHVHPSGIVVDDSGQEYSPRKFNPAHGQGIAPVFAVDNVEHVETALRARRVRFRHEEGSAATGPRIKFDDPFGHPFIVSDRRYAPSRTLAV